MLTDAQIAIKAATRRAIQLAGGPVAVAKAVRVDQGRLSCYGNPNHPLFVPLDVAHEIDKLAGDNIILRALAELIGFDIAPRSSVDEQVSRDMTALAGSIARESGELIESAIEAASDGKMTPAEARRIHDEADDVGEKIVQIKSAARRVMCG